MRSRANLAVDAPELVQAGQGGHAEVLQGRGSVDREQSAEGGVEGHPAGGAQLPHHPAAVGVEPSLHRRWPRHGNGSDRS